MTTDTRAALARLDDLPKGSELERAALALLHDVTVDAWKAADLGGPAAFTRVWGRGLLAAFDVLTLDAGADEAGDAVAWAVERMAAITDAIAGPSRGRALSLIGETAERSPIGETAPAS